MLVGYVADERYLALSDVVVDFTSQDGTLTTARSSAGGAIVADIQPGTYRVTLNREGFGPKTVDVELSASEPYLFRLLANRLLGYAWPKWVKTGERSEFRVHSVHAYRLSLWRYGLKREQVKLIGWFDEHGPRATMQVTPDGDYTQTGVEWNKRGYASKHHTQFMAGPEKSGLYYFHAETEEGEFFTFPWVVAPAVPSARIAVLASTNTWNAYNNFGGRSNYINATSLPVRPVANARLEMTRYLAGTYNEWQFADDLYQPLSFDRPEPLNAVLREEEATDPIRGRQPCHLAPAEWRLLAWLEREGFDYDFYSESQLHYGQLPLDSYDVLMLSSHPEYWSAEMYRQVKEWVFERGGRLMYLAGNGINCEVEFLDPDRLWFKSYVKPGEESRFGRTVESEANLLGVAYTEAGIMTAAPYEVLDEHHWVFKGTGLKNGDHFGFESLHERIPGGASGHETDKRTPSSPANLELIARGLNPDKGGAEMVYHEPGGGGAVFSAGSITWPACVLVDPHISRITRNVLERFLV